MILFLGYLAVHCSESAKSTDGISMYVAAKSGLIVRSDATTKAGKLGVIPFAENVQVLEQKEATITITGKTGHWSRVRYGELEGWSFGGFLSSTPVGQETAIGGNQTTKATFESFELGDIPHYTFKTESGQFISFSRNDSRAYEFTVEVPANEVNQGWGSSPLLVGKLFEIEYTTEKYCTDCNYAELAGNVLVIKKIKKLD